MSESERIKLEKSFLAEEIMDHEIFSHLARAEKDSKLKKLLEKLADTEKRHAESWRGLLGEKRAGEVRKPVLGSLKIFEYLAIRKFLGTAFVSKLLGMNESATLARYKQIISDMQLSADERKHITEIIKDEEETEADLKKSVQEYEGTLNHIGSIVFGLNDGLVEILAAVAGLAVLANSPITVVVGGLIVGVSGTLSMAGGAYLSAKSHGLVEDSINPKNERDREEEKSTPGSEAFYTGIFYLAGALVPVIPFIVGLQGYAGIVVSVVLVSLVLAIASVVIAIISSSSIKRRVFEMLAISLGAAFATIILGSVVKLYFGITI